MDKNYLTYPCKVMKITQNYNGKTSHYPHTVGNYRDYPIDEGCGDTGKDPIFCPCDEMVVKRVYGVGTRGTNTVWLESTTKVHFADGTRDYFTMLITHPDDKDLRGVVAGRRYKRWEQITFEGKDGATANHLHISGGKGKYRGNGWLCNSRGKYVLNCTGGAYKPEKLFFIDPKYTRVISKGGLVFKELPNEYDKGNYIVDTSVLRIRKGAGTNFAQVGVLAKGKKVKILDVDGVWGRYAKDKWISLEYCKKA